MLEYIAVLPSAWCYQTGRGGNNYESGISYQWDGDRFPTRKEAIERGYHLRDSDDFNIAVLHGNTLVSFDWLYESIDEDAETMLDIACQLGLNWGT